jgi:hypothetical protein
MLWVVGLLLLQVSAQEPLRSEWTFMQVDGGKILIEARDAKAAQTLSVWVGKSLEVLQTEWGQTVPFQPKAPLRIRITPEALRIQLFEDRAPGRYVQEIRVPEEASLQNPLELADAFTRAMLNRMLWMHRPRDVENVSIEAPDWLVAGYSHVLLSGASAAMFEALFAHLETEPLSFPEQIASQKPSSGTDLIYRAESALLCRWVLGDPPGRSEWTWLATHVEPTLEDWVARLRTPGDLRDLHMQWHVWMEAEKLNLISEYQLLKPAVDLLEERRRIHPALLGVSGLSKRYEAMELSELEQELEHPGVDDLLGSWSVRLQPVGFRQSEAFHQALQSYLRAGLTLRQAAKSTGRKRTDALESFHLHLGVAMDQVHRLMFEVSGKESAEYAEPKEEKGQD